MYTGTSISRENKLNFGTHQTHAVVRIYYYMYNTMNTAQKISLETRIARNYTCVHTYMYISLVCFGKCVYHTNRTLAGFIQSCW